MYVATVCVSEIFDVKKFQKIPSNTSSSKPFHFYQENDCIKQILERKFQK